MLMDQIVASRLVLPRGDVRVSRRDAMQLRCCPLRYVLDADASKQCSDLLRECPELPSLEREVLRLPAAVFWLEWFAEPLEGGQKLGCLVQASEDGRSGTVLPYYTTTAGRPQRLPGVIEFDLDGEARPNVRGSRQFAHRLFPHLDHVLTRVAMTMDPGWISTVAKAGEATLRNKMTLEAEGTWFFIPYLLTFSVLLSSPNVLREKHSVSAPQDHRAGARRPPLGHVEVSLRLGEYAPSSDRPAGNSDSGRAMPRMHVVRGHYVSRGLKTFWRMSHLRGSGDWTDYSKTVRVKAARRPASFDGALASQSARRSAVTSYYNS